MPSMTNREYLEYQDLLDKGFARGLRRLLEGSSESVPPTEQARFDQLHPKWQELPTLVKSVNRELVGSGRSIDLDQRSAEEQDRLGVE